MTAAAHTHPGRAADPDGPRYYERLIDLVGETPLLRLGRVAASARPLVLAKLEHFNPGGSIKDRIALRMVEAAEARGELRAGGTIVEPTSGNTGVGLAMVARLKGYRCVFTCPDKVSTDKLQVLRALGAEVVVCPAAVPPDHPDSYRSVARKLTDQTPGAVRLDQYSNMENPQSHYHGTGPEIWHQTAGRITHLVVGIGTGGTITGAGRYLKEVSHGRVRVVGVDPEGSVYASGQPPRPYLVEGVGQPVLPDTYDPGVPDEIVTVTDRDSLHMTRELARSEGLLVGPSCGMAVSAALWVARSLAQGDLVVVVLPDSGRGYLSKVFDDGWMRRHGFLGSTGTGVPLADVHAAGGREVGGPLVVRPGDTVRHALRLMRAERVTHLPVVRADPPVRLAEIVGSVSIRSLLPRLLAGQVDAEIGPVDAEIGQVMDGPLPIAGIGQHVDEVAGALADQGAVALLDNGVLHGVVTGPDVLAHLTAPPAAPS
jgi:cystathionine beta-synthase